MAGGRRGGGGRSAGGVGVWVAPGVVRSGGEEEVRVMRGQGCCVVFGHGGKTCGELSMLRRGTGDRGPEGLGGLGGGVVSMGGWQGAGRE